MERVLSVQFGNTYQRRSPGYTVLCRVYANPCSLWLDAVNEGAFLDVEDALCEGFVQSTQAATFAAGLPPGPYRITVTSFDPLKRHGPFSITANGIELKQDVVVPAGTLWRESFEVNLTDALHLRFEPSVGNDFLLNALVVEGQSRVALRSLFRTAPPAVIPSHEELQANANEDSRAALRRICDWLIGNCRPDGFIGDAWTVGASHWYTTSMPVRALLAGFDILGETRFREAAFAELDLFVGEQLPNGAWTGVFRGQPTAGLSKAAVDDIMINARQPMSDIGSVVTALAIGSHYASSPRKERYLASVRHFCNDWASRYQERSGGFTDGPWAKDYFTTIYSCATAIEAASHAMLYAACGEPHYIESANRAIAFLLPDWRSDGRMTGRAPHWEVRNHKPFVMETLYFGDQWYYDEGFITVRHHTPDLAFRQRIDQALQWRVFGSEGLLAALGDEVWWPIQDTWNNAKSIGMVQTLLHARNVRMSTPALRRALTDMQRFLCTPEYARRLGIMVDDAERPVHVHGLMTWSGMRMEATGFAGMTLAEMMKPGILYLADIGTP